MGMPPCRMPHAGLGSSGFRGELFWELFQRLLRARPTGYNRLSHVLSYNEVGDSRHKELLRIEDVDFRHFYIGFPRQEYRVRRMVAGDESPLGRPYSGLGDLLLGRPSLFPG